VKTTTILDHARELNGDLNAADQIMRCFKNCRAHMSFIYLYLSLILVLF
jgi:hypothetical protein